jgi:hypothetical protein
MENAEPGDTRQLVEPRLPLMVAVDVGDDAFHAPIRG